MSQYQNHQLTNNLPGGLAQPAQRVLAGANIQSLQQLACHTEAEIRQLHGIGPKLRRALATKGLSFRGEKEGST